MLGDAYNPSAPDGKLVARIVERVLHSNLMQELAQTPGREMKIWEEGRVVAAAKGELGGKALVRVFWPNGVVVAVRLVTDGKKLSFETIELLFDGPRVVEREVALPWLPPPKERGRPAKKREAILAALEHERNLSGVVNFSEVARQLRVSNTTVARAAETVGIVAGRRGPKVSQEKRDEVLAALSKGGTFRGVAQEVGISGPTVAKIAKEADIERARQPVNRVGAKHRLAPHRA
jgi:hypothetical protein